MPSPTSLVISNGFSLAALQHGGRLLRVGRDAWRPELVLHGEWDQILHGKIKDQQRCSGIIKNESDQMLSVIYIPHICIYTLLARCLISYRILPQ